MAIKKINTDLQIEAGLLDGDGNSGVLNQVLVSTGTGVDWVDGSGSGIIGGPYLPLAGGTMSGALNILIPGDPKLILQSTSGDTSDWNYINFVGRDAVRDGFVGTDADGDMQVYSDKNSSSVQLTASGIVLNGGNVGIGVTGPLSKLHVNGGNISIQNVDSSSPYTASGKLRFLGRYDRYLGGINTVNTGSYAEYDNGLDFYVQRDTFDAAGHFAMRINHLGNVGIGTTSPDARLEVRSDGAVAGGAEIRLQHANNNTNDVVSTVNFANNAGSIGMIQAGTAEANNTGYIALFTDIAGTSSERMRVHTNGNVGIGTASPNRSLHVIGQVAIDNSTSPSGGLLVSPDGTSNKVYSRTGNATSSAHPLDFISGSSTSMRIDTGGNVGIGTTSPSAKLVVQGTAGNLYIDDLGAGYNYYDASNVHNFRNTSGTSRLYINTSTGNVGIGTTSPTHKLQVVGNGAFNSTLGVQDPDVSSNGLLQLLHDSTGSSIYSNPASSNGSTVVLRLGINNSEKMRIANNGNVGIGTTSPESLLHLESASGPALQIKNTTNNVTFKVYSQGNNTHLANVSDHDLFIDTNNTARIIVKYSGKVGIGTTSPDAKLDIINSSLSTMFRLSNTEANSTNKYGAILGRHYNNGEENVTGMLITSTSSAIGSTVSIGGGITTANAVNTVLFYTAANNFTLTGTERMRISSAGNVGIGTTSPGSILHMVGTSPEVRIASSADGQTARLGLYEDTAGTQLGGYIQYVGSSDTLRLGIVNSGANTDVITVTDTFNVGIGTSAPGYKLEVNNSAIAADNYIAVISNNSNNSGVIFRDASGNRGLIFANPDNELVFMANGFSEKMRISSSGNVGIGTTSPQSKLTLNTNTTSPGSMLEINNRGDFAAGSWSAIRFGLDSGTFLGQYGKGGIIYESRDAYNRGKLHLAVDSVADNGSITLTDSILTADGTSGNVGIGTTNPGEKLDVNGNLIVSGNFNSLYIGGKTDSNVDGIRMLCAGDDSFIDCRGGSGLNFRLDDTTGDTQRIKFHSGGNVSIGNTNNSYKLDVTGTGNFAGNLQISTVDQQTTRLLLKNTNSTGGRTFALVGGVHNETQDGFSIYDTVAAATRFTILNNGDVGIGTTSPSQKLEVNGTIKATDYKGYLPAFQHGGFLHSASASSSYIYWIPTNSLSEVISSQYYNNWIAPYSGRVKKIIMKWTGPSAAPTATSVTFRYALYPNTSSDTFPATVVDGASTNMTVTKAFGDTDITFNAGDRVQLGFTTDGGTRLLQAFAYTVVLEYDKD